MEIVAAVVLGLCVYHGFKPFLAALVNLADAPRQRREESARRAKYKP